MTTINWSGGSGSWGNAANWNGGTPNEADDVQIEVPNITVTIGNGVAAQAYTLTTQYSTLNMTGGSLFTVSNASIGGAWTQSGGLYEASGLGATFGGGLTMTGGTMEALAGATFNIASNASLAGTFTGTGTLEFTGGVTYIQSGFSSSISNFVVSSLLGFNTNFSTSSYFAELSNGSIDLFGHKLVLSGNVLIDGILGNGQVTDAGTMTLGVPQNNNTVLDNGLVVSVTKEVLQNGNVSFGTSDAGAKVNVTKKGEYLINGNWNVYDPSSVGSLTNAGLFAKTGGGKTATLFTSFSNTGKVETQTGVLQLSGLVNALSGTVSGAGTLAVGGNGQTTFGTKLTLSEAGFAQQSATLVLNHGLSYAGEWDMNGGVLNLNTTSAVLTLTGHDNFDGGTITGYGGGMVLDGATQIGNDTIGGPTTLTINGTVHQTNTITFGLSSNPVANISAGASWYIESNSSIDGAYGLIDNAGTFSDPNGAGIATVGCEFESTGTLTVTTGTLAFAGPTYLGGTVNGNGELWVASYGLLESGVALNVASFNTSGDTVVQGALTYAGAFSQTGGMLDLDASPLTLTGSASLDSGQLTDNGTLAVAGHAVIANYIVANGSTLMVTGAAAQVADVTVSLATIDVAQGGVYTIDDDNNVLQNNGTSFVDVAGELVANGTGLSSIVADVSVNGTLQVNTGTLQLVTGGSIGGTVQGAGTLSLADGVFNLAAGLDDAVAALVLQSSASFSITANESFGGYFVDNGYLNLSGAATLSTTGTTLISGSVNISGNGTVIASSDTTLSGVSLINGATLELTSTAEQGPSNVSVGPTSTLIVSSTGTYSLDAGQSILGSGTLDVAGTLNATEDGNGLISANIVDAGKISSNLGTLDILNAVSGSGSFVIGATGNLEFALGSAITASNTISFGASGATLILQDEANGKPTFGALLAGFATGDTIELWDFSAATSVGTLLAGNKLYEITDSANGNSITLTFTTTQNAGNLYIGTAGDGRALVLHH